MYMFVQSLAPMTWHGGLDKIPIFLGENNQWAPGCGNLVYACVIISDMFASTDQKITIR